MPGRAVVYRDPQVGRMERLPDPDAERRRYRQRQVHELATRPGAIEAGRQAKAHPMALPDNGGD